MVNLYDFQDGKFDPREWFARDFFDKYGSGAYLIHETTSGEAALYHAAEAVSRGQRVVILEPTGKLVKEMVERLPSYCTGVNWPKVVRVPPNKECKVNAEMIEEHPGLIALPVMPMPGGCEECKYRSDCRTLDVVSSDWDVCVLTNQKLIALALAPQNPDAETLPLSKQLLRELRRADVFIVDQCHELERGHSVGVRVEWNGQPWHEMGKYGTLGGLYPSVRRVISNFEQLLTDPEPTIIRNELVTMAESKDHWKQQLSRCIKNPYAEHVTAAMAVEFFTELRNLMIAREKYELDAMQVRILHFMFCVAKAEKFTVSAAPGKWNGEKGVWVSYDAIDNDFSVVLRSFLSGVIGERKRVLFTSSVIGSHDYSQYVRQGVTKLFFGGEDLKGDPMRANANQLILVDGRSLTTIGRDNVWKKEERESIVDFIAEAKRRYGAVEVVTHSETMARSLRVLLNVNEWIAEGGLYRFHDYRNGSTTGIASDAQVLIAVGIAHKPSHTFDSIARDAEDSLRILLEAIHADTYLDWSRVKDSEGSLPSVVFALNVSLHEALAVVTQGKGRVLLSRPEVKKHRETFFPQCDETIKPPHVFECARAEMLDKADEYISRKSIVPNRYAKTTVSHPEKYPIEYNTFIGYFLDNSEEDLRSPLYVSKTKALEHESDMFSTGNGQTCDEIDRRLNTFEQNYPIDDSDEVLGLPIDDDYPDLKKEYTVESWAAWEGHLDEQFKSIRVSPGWYCNDTLTFLHHVFATRPDLIYIQQVLNGKQSYIAKKRPPYITLEAQMTWIDRHTAGTITIGSPCIDENGNVKWGCYDIDAHQKKTDTSTVLIKKRYWAELKTMKLLAYLHKKGIPYILEQSGSTASYHIWISVVPVDAKVAMWTFRAIALAAGVTDIEINPKQGKAGAKGSGNQVKLPLGRHQAHRGRSKLYINGKWVGPRWSDKKTEPKPGEFADIMHRAIDIRDVDMDCPKLVRIADIPEVYLVEDGREYCKMESVEYGTGGVGEYAGIRRFFLWLLTQDLSGEQGHWARIYLAREFLNAGWTHEDIARLFEHQSDYDFDESLKGVKSVAEKDYKNIPYESIWLRCQSFAEKYEQETGYRLSTSEGAAAY